MEFARKTENEQHLQLIGKVLLHGEDLIFDYSTCMIFINAHDISQNIQELYERVVLLTEVYTKCWIALEINPSVDKYGSYFTNMDITNKF